MKINSPFTEAGCVTLTTVIAILSPLPCHAQSILGFPLVSLEIKIVPEEQVCRLPEGYESGDCPQLRFEYVEKLEGANIKRTPSPPNQEIKVSRPDDDSDNIFVILNEYYDAFVKRRGLPLPLYLRKSVVFIFDFGESHEGFDITIKGFQPKDPKNRLGCRKREITDTEPWIYKTSVNANSRYSFYHQKADFAIPCSNVKWQLTAKGKQSNQTYAWTFNTTP
jgi:hypothetical protein